MGWLTKMLSPEDPAAPIWPASFLADGIPSNDAGIEITALNSRSASGVLACTRVISEAGASYPKEIYQKLGAGKKLADTHPLYPIIHGCPNPQMTNFVFWVAVLSQVCLWGKGFAQIQRDGANRARALWPLPSASTRAVRVDGKVVYRTTAGVANGAERTIASEDILHFPFLSFDGVDSYSPVQLRRQGLAMSMAAERFGSMLFGKGARPSGVLEVANVMKPEAKAALKQSWQEGTSGSNAMGVALLEPGVTFKPLTIDPKDAQFLETRKYQLEEIARDYRVPPHMIGILERATHSNAEQLGYEFNTYTMLAWVHMIEQEINRKLFTDGKYFCKLNMDIFLRGDFETRTAGYERLRNIGVLSTDDINDNEGWQRIGPENGGDVRYVPLNMTPLKSMKALEDTPPEKVQPPPAVEGQAPEVKPADPKPADKATTAKAFARLFADAAGRTLHRQKRDAVLVQKIWEPLLSALAETLGGELPDGYMDSLAARCVDWRKEDTASIADAELALATRKIAEAGH